MYVAVNSLHHHKLFPQWDPEWAITELSLDAFIKYHLQSREKLCLHDNNPTAQLLTVHQNVDNMK